MNREADGSVGELDFVGRRALRVELIAAGRSRIGYAELARPGPVGTDPVSLGAEPGLAVLGGQRHVTFGEMALGAADDDLIARCGRRGNDLEGVFRLVPSLRCDRDSSAVITSGATAGRDDHERRGDKDTTTRGQARHADG